MRVPVLTLFILFCFYVIPVQSAILVLEPNGSFVQKISLEDAATASDTIGKTIVVTSHLTVEMSNISHVWPVDRKLRIEKGGSINNTAIFKILGPFEAGLHKVFNGTGSVIFGTNSVIEIYPEWWGAIGDGKTDCTAAIQTAINSSNIDMSGFVIGRNVQFTSGTYLVTSAIKTDKILKITGAGRYSTEIKLRPTSGSAVTMLACAGLTLRSIHINGMPTDAKLYFRQGDVAIQSNGDLNLDDVKISGFQYGVFWGGGYYHKIHNCHFNYISVALYGYDSNNLQISKTKFNKLDAAVNFKTGSGPLSFNQCSFEEWTSTLAYGTHGALSMVAFTDCYFENAPTVKAGHGLATEYFNNGVIASGVKTLTMIDNSISLLGVRYVLRQIPTANIVSLGNRFNYSPGTKATCEYIYSPGPLMSGIFSDYAYAMSSEIEGRFSTTYIGATLSPSGARVVYDPINGIDLSPDQITYWTAATLLNGWANSSVGTYRQAGYRKINNIVYLQGAVVAASATNQIIFTLPSGYRYTAATTSLVTSNHSGVPVAVLLEITTDGNVKVVNNSYTKLGHITLDGLNFSTY